MHILVLLGLLTGCMAEPSNLGDTAYQGSEDHVASSSDDDTEIRFRDDLGTISGDCGVLDDEFSKIAPYLFRSGLDLGTAGFDETLLSADGALILSEGTLGGSSVNSEVTAFEFLARCEGATLIASETKIEYLDAGGKKTDILVDIDGHHVGVSVTRAFHWPPEDNPFTVEEAHTLLGKKLGDIPKSAANAAPLTEWRRSMLVILAWNSQYADAVQTAWDELDHDAKRGLARNTLVMVVHTDGMDDDLY